MALARYSLVLLLLVFSTGCDTSLFFPEAGTWEPPSVPAATAAERLRLGTELKAMGLHEEARAQLTSLLDEELPPAQEIQALTHLADSLFALKREEEAVALLERLRKTHPSEKGHVTWQLYRHHRERHDWAAMLKETTRLLDEMKLEEGERTRLEASRSWLRRQLRLDRTVVTRFGKNQAREWLVTDPHLVRLRPDKRSLEMDLGRGTDYVLLPIPHAGGPFRLELDWKIPRLAPGAEIRFGFGGISGEQLSDIGDARSLRLEDSVRTTLRPDAHFFWRVTSTTRNERHRFGFQFGDPDRFRRFPIAPIGSDWTYRLSVEHVPAISTLIIRLRPLDAEREPVETSLRVPDLMKEKACFLGLFPSHRGGEGWVELSRLSLALDPERRPPLPVLPAGLRRYFDGCRAILDGERNEALAQFDEAVRMAPQLGDAFYQRGVLRLQTGDAAGAARDFLLVLREIPRVYKHLQKALNELLREKKWLALIDVLRSYREIDTRLRVESMEDDILADLRGTDPPTRMKARLLVELGHDLQESTDSVRRERGRKLLARGILLLNGILEANPKELEMRLLRARAHRLAGNPSLAQIDYMRAKRLNDAEPAVFLGLGQILLDHGQAATATIPLSRGVELDRTDPKAHLLRGRAWFERKEYEKARRDFETVLELRPRSWKAHAWLGQIPEPHMSDRERRLHREWAERIAGRTRPEGVR